MPLCFDRARGSYEEKVALTFTAYACGPCLFNVRTDLFPYGPRPRLIRALLINEQGHH